MAKKLKLKIPKRIAGVKIPKSVRKGPVADFVNSSAGQIVIAEALVVLGGALAARRGDSAIGEFLRHPVRTAGDFGHRAAERGHDARRTLANESDRLSNAFHEAVLAFQAAMEERPLEAADQGSDSARADLERDVGPAEPVDVPRPKKNRASSQTAQGENPSTPH